MSQHITIADVAAEAGVSAMTVSNAVNGRPGLSDETRARVLEVAERIGYVPSASARNLKRARTGLIGVITLDLTGQYAQELVRGIADELADEELELLISASYHDAGRERERALFLGRGLVDGLILIAPVLEDETKRAIRKLRIPVVVIDPREVDPGFSHVLVDNYGGMRSAVEHLLAGGHRNIGFIGGDHDFVSSAERYRAFVDAMNDSGCAVRPEQVRESDFTYAGGKRALRSLRETFAPTAVIASSDLIAFGVVDQGRESGLSIPNDLSVVGFDDLPQAANSFPGLTTVRQPLHDMGREAVKMVLGQLEKGIDTSARTVLPTSLIRRGTVSAVNRVSAGNDDPGAR